MADELGAPDRPRSVPEQSKRLLAPKLDAIPLRFQTLDDVDRLRLDAAAALCCVAESIRLNRIPREEIAELLLAIARKLEP